MKSFIKSEHGFALVYGLVVLMLATVGGTSLLFIAQRDRIGVSDYSKMRSASQAAVAALKACEGQFTKDPGTALSILKKYKTDTKYKWLLGNAGNSDVEQKIKFWNGADAPEFSARIMGFDDTKYLIRIEGIGYGNYGGKKRVIASYYLGGLGIVAPPAAGGGNKHAIFIEGAGRNFDQKVTVNGDVYFGGNVMFNTNATGSIINGSLKTGTALNASEFNASVTVNGSAYFQTPVKCQNKPLVINGLAGFEKYLDLPSSSITVKKDAWYNGSFTGAGKVDMSNKTATHSGSCTDGNFTNAASVVDAGGTINIAAQLGQTSGNESPCTIDLSGIPAAKIRSFPLLNMPDLRGDWLDAAYDWHKDNNYLWNEFLVLSVSSPAEAPTINTGGYTFNKKVIWIFENASVAVNGKWYSSGPNSVSLIHIKSGSLSNFGWQDLFRGYINVTGTGKIVYQTKKDATLAGALHHVSTYDQSFQMNDNNNNLNINYDAAVMSTLSDVGVLKCTGGSTPSPGTGTPVLTLTDVKIRPTLLGMQL